MGWFKAIMLVIRYAPAIVEAVKIVLQRHPDLVPESSKLTAAKMLVKVGK